MAIEALGFVPTTTSTVEKPATSPADAQTDAVRTGLHALRAEAHALQGDVTSGLTSVTHEVAAGVSSLRALRTGPDKVSYGEIFKRVKAAARNAVK